MDTFENGSAHKFERVCTKCGYSLRGLSSSQCPECGREFDPNSPLPHWAWKYFQPMKWPAKAAMIWSIVFLAMQAFLIMPLYLAIPLWLMAFVLIGIPCWRRVAYRRKLLRENGIIGINELPDRSIIRNSRKWIYLSFVMTILQIPQFSAIAFDLPWLTYKAHKMYEVDPFFGPHDSWIWSGINHVEVHGMEGSGVYIDVGMQRMGYCSHPPPTEMGDGRGGWEHLYGPWWYWISTRAINGSLFPTLD